MPASPGIPAFSQGSLLVRLCLGLALALLLLLPAGLLHGEETQAPAAALQSPGAFYNLDEEQRNRLQDIKFEFTVHYYDGDWNVLWGETKEGPFFFKTSGEIMAIKSGDLVRFEGRVSERQGLQPAPNGVQVLGNTPRPPAPDANLLLDKPERVNQSFVRLHGMVDYIEQPDASHTKFGLITNKRAITVIVRNSQQAPRLGAVIEVTGYLALEPTNLGTQNINLWVEDTSAIEFRRWIQQAERFDLPFSAISSLSSAPQDRHVRIRGRVKQQMPGSGIWLTGDEAEVWVESPQRALIPVGSLVEATGIPGMKGKQAMLAHAVYFDIQQMTNLRASPNVSSLRPVITSASELYTLSVADRQEDLPFDAIFRVLFYDPHWKTLWAEDNSSRFYIPPGQKPLPFRSGQLVHVRGLYSEPQGLRAEAKDVRILEDSHRKIPVDITSTITDHRSHNGRWVQLTSYVEKIERVDPNHIALQVIAGERRAVIIVLTETNEELPRLEGAVIAAQGLLSYTAPQQQQPEIYSFMVPSTDQLRQLHWLRSDPRFSMPLVTASQFPELPTESFVRVTGRVTAFSTGQFIDLEDATGQIRLQCLQTEKLREGEVIEAIGLPSSTGLRNQLRTALFIRSSSTLQSVNPTTTSQALRLVSHVAGLSASEASRRFPVVVRVHVTWSHPSRGDFYGEDSSGSIQCVLSNTAAVPPTPGDIVDIVGESDGSTLHPRIRVSIATKLRYQAVPSAIPRALDQLRTGLGLHSAVELRALLRRIEREEHFQRLELLTNTGPLEALVPLEQDVSRFLGAIINVRGVSTLLSSGLRTPNVTLLCLPYDAVSLVQAPPDRLPSLPTQSLSALILAPPQPRDEHWVRLLGRITHHQERSHLYIQEGGNALQVFSAQAGALAPGDTVEIIGMPAWYQDRLVLRDAYLRKLRPGEAPSPRELQTPQGVDAAMEHTLVSLGGELVSQISLESSTTYTLRSGSQLFNATLQHHARRPAPVFANGSTLQLTGIYHIARDTDDARPVFSLELRSAGDLRLLESPTWLTPGRALAILAGLSLLILATVAWILQLRRVVSHQTLTIRQQMEKEAQLTADLERASRLESLGMLAGGIAHDFNNMLTIIVGNLSLARMEVGGESAAGPFLQEAERGAMRARNLTQQLLTFARGGNPIRKAENLPALLRDEVADATGNGQLIIDFNLPAECPPAFVDRSQLSQVVHSLIGNAIQEGARRMIIAVRNEELRQGNPYGMKPGTALRVLFSDDGPGIPVDNLTRLFDPYFTTHKGRRGLGLSLVRSIVVKHEGYVSASNAEGGGAEFVLLLPVAPAEITAGPLPLPGAAGDAGPASPAPPAPGGGARILLMDDEAPIRLMVSALLRKLGHQVSLASEGAAAVRDYKSALEAGKPFDLVILDLSVPNGMGGMEAMEQLRSLDPGVLAIVSSGYSNDPIMADHRSFGFAAMVPKPYQIDELTRAVTALLAQRPHR